MNAAGITTMASPQSVATFEAAGESRATAFLPGGRRAVELATFPVACVIGDTVFCHGGLTVQQVAVGLEAGNAAASDWLSGRGSPLPPELLWPTRGRPSPLWMRDLSDPPMREPSTSACADLTAALEQLGASRLVVGHTVQPGGVNCACGCKVFRIDVGLSEAMGGAQAQALEISSDGRVRLLT